MIDNDIKVTIDEEDNVELNLDIEKFKGLDGLSAYDIYKKNVAVGDNILTEKEWLDSFNKANYYKQYKSTFISNIDNTYEIPIEDSRYNDTALLEVYISGLKLSCDEYTISNNCINLVKPILKDTQVEIIIYKTVVATVNDYDSLKGDTGNSGVFLGKNQPSDEDVNVWINPDNKLKSNSDNYFLLVAVTNNPPTECFNGDAYYDTDLNKLVFANDTNEWGPIQRDPNENVTYIDTSSNIFYKYENEKMVAKFILSNIPILNIKNSKGEWTGISTIGITQDLTEYVKYSALNNEISNISTLLNEYKSLIPYSKSTATNSIRLDNCADINCKSLVLKGNTKQNSTKGYQLIDFSNPTENTPYAVSTFTNDILTVSNTEGTYQCVRWDILNLAKKNPGKILYFSFENYDISNTNTSRINIKQRINDNTLFLGLVNSNATQLSVTIPTEIDNLTEYTLQILSNNSGTDTAATLKIIKPMLQFGTDKLEYEQYTGGQASPNPNYPQDIKNITGTLNLKNVGSNLFKPEFVQSRWGNSSTTRIESMRLNISNINDSLSVTTNIDLSIYNWAINISNSLIGAHTGSGFFDSGWINDEIKSLSLEQLTTQKEKGNIYLFIVIGKKNNSSITIDEMSNFNFQIKRGTYTIENMPDFESYQEQQLQIDLKGNKLCSNKDKTVRDEYNLETGKLKKKFKTVVLNGSESGWSKLSNSGDYIRMALNLNDIYSYTDSSRHIDKIMCSHFTPSTTNGYDIIYQYKNQILFYPNAEITTLDKWKAWLSENNIIVCYELAEPEEIQLDPVDIKMLDGTNNISVNANLDADFDIEYYKKPTVTDETVQNETNEVTEVNEVTSDE